MFNFGSSNPATTTATAFSGFTMPSVSQPNFAAPTTTASLFNFGSATTQPTFGTTAATTVTSTPNFGTPSFTQASQPAAQPTTSMFTFSTSTQPATTLAPATNLLPNQPASSAPTSTAPTFATGTVTSLAGSTPIFGPPATATTVTGTAPASVSSTFTFPSPATTAATTTAASTTAAATISLPTLPLATTTAQPGQTQSAKMTFSQLQEHINKWLDELTILEVDFHEQAQNINVWDSILINNANKLTTLTERMEQLKTDHTRINNQIDFIESQQNELEELIKPLEDEKSKMLDTVVVSEKEKFYQLMETVNNDLQGVAADIQTVIEQFNSANSVKDASDPLASIGKVLNTHMTLLKHIDDQINSIDMVEKM